MLPDLLPFVVRDYDSHFGFDGLASRNKELAINETKHLFVEFKQELSKEFNHSPAGQCAERRGHCFEGATGTTRPQISSPRGIGGLAQPLQANDFL